MNVKRLSRRAALTLTLALLATALFAADAPRYEYRVLATKKTSTMEKELNEIAAAGFAFHSVMGGETALGGDETVVVMAKEVGAERSSPMVYKLLATSKTSTMEKEMQEIGVEGFRYRGQTVFKSTFGGQEVLSILELDPEKPAMRIEYKLLATKKTSTMEKELQEAGAAGFALAGLTVSTTTFGGTEVVCILQRESE